MTHEKLDSDLETLHQTLVDDHEELITPVLSGEQPANLGDVMVLLHRIALAGLGIQRELAFARRDAAGLQPQPRGDHGSSSNGSAGK